MAPEMREAAALPGAGQYNVPATIGKVTEGDGSGVRWWGRPPC